MEDRRTKLKPWERFVVTGIGCLVMGAGFYVSANVYWWIQVSLPSAIAMLAVAIGLFYVGFRLIRHARTAPPPDKK